MQTITTERENINARSGRFTQRIGSTVYEVRVCFDTAKKELLEDKILRLIMRDLEFGANRETKGKDLNFNENGVIITLPQADGLPERGSV